MAIFRAGVVGQIAVVNHGDALQSHYALIEIEPRDCQAASFLRSPHNRAAFSPHRAGILPAVCHG